MGFAAQIALSTATAAAFLLTFIAVRDGNAPSIATIQQYVSLITWQVLALVAGIVFFPQLYRMMGEVKEFDFFGLKGRIGVEDAEEAEDEAEAEVEKAVATEGTQEALQEAVTEQADSPLERYKAAMKVWSVVAYIIRDLAVQNGSTFTHANQTSEQIPELSRNNAISEGQARRAERLLDIRNGWRRNSSKPIDQTEFASFQRSSKRLGTELSRLIELKRAQPVAVGNN